MSALTHGRRTLHEQPHRFDLHRVVRRHVLGGYDEGSEHHDAFAADAEPFATGGEHAHRRARSLDRVDHLRGGVEQVLTVVEHHQQLRRSHAATTLSVVD